MIQPVSVLHVHTDDVKSVVYSEKCGLISCSRDGSIIRWDRFMSKGQEPQPEPEQLYKYPRVFLNSLALLDDGSILLCGGSDGKIRAIDLNTTEVKLFEGHSSNVCCLAVDPNNSDSFVSGSWDHSIQVWSYKDPYPIQQLCGHTASVWCCTFSPDSSLLLTGSADKTIVLWNKIDNFFQRLHFLNAHDDCVRCINFISKNLFASAGNDCIIKLWELEGTNIPVCLQTLKGHTNFIFSMAFQSLLASAGEDRTIRIWKVGDKKLTLSEVIQVPTETCWALTWLDKESKRLAVACSDKSVRIFSSDHADFDEKYAESYNKELSEMEIYADEIKGIDPSTLITVDKLLMTTGDHPNQIILCTTDDGSIQKYEWYESRWRLIGTGKKPERPAKQNLNGKAYDYVFNVAMEGNDGNQMKLGYNVGEDPKSAADRFIMEHKIDPVHTGDIVEFLVRNVPDANVPIPAVSKYFPQKEYVRFDRPINATAMMQKVSNMNKDGQLSDGDLNVLSELAKGTTPKIGSAQNLMPIIKKVMCNWPLENLFPVFDVLRLVMTTSPRESFLQKLEEILADEFQRAKLLQLLSPDRIDSNAALVLLRLLANTVDDSEPKLLYSLLSSETLENVGKCAANSGKVSQISTAVATILLNLSVRLYRTKDSSGDDRLLRALIKCLSQPTGGEAAFRSCVAVGTLIKTNNSYKEKYELGIFAAFLLSSADDSEKLRSCKSDLSNLLE